jgi:hypothetical protein
MTIKKTCTILKLDFLSLTDIFEYLDELRESGETNMFGASPYLMSDFDMGRTEASDALSAWMNTFSNDEGALDRAKKALAAASESTP